MHSFQNFIVRLVPNHPPPLETRIWKLVVRALVPRESKFAVTPLIGAHIRTKSIIYGCAFPYKGR